MHYRIILLYLKEAINEFNGSRYMSALCHII